MSELSKIIGVLLLVVAAVTILISGLERKIKNDVQTQNRAAYPAWVKLTGRTDITFEEWLAMKNSGVLKQEK